MRGALHTNPSPPPACLFFHPPSASYWGDYDTHHIFPPHLPTSHSFLITMQCAHWYSNCALGYDLINGIWLLAWILEMCLVFFWTLKMAEAEGKRGPGRPKMLASGGIALPIRLQEPHFPPHLRTSIACDYIYQQSQMEGQWQEWIPIYEKESQNCKLSCLRLILES